MQNKTKHETDRTSVHRFDIVYLPKQSEGSSFKGALNRALRRVCKYYRKSGNFRELKVIMECIPKDQSWQSPGEREVSNLVRDDKVHNIFGPEAAESIDGSPEFLNYVLDSHGSQFITVAKKEMPLAGLKTKPSPLLSFIRWPQESPEPGHDFWYLEFSKGVLKDPKTLDSTVTVLPFQSGDVRASLRPSQGQWKISNASALISMEKAI